MYYRRIRDLRTDHDLRQIDVAEYLGCHEGVYRRYENGTRGIPLWALLKQAERYNVSVDYMLGITDNKKNMANRVMAFEFLCHNLFYIVLYCKGISFY